MNTCRLIRFKSFIKFLRKNKTYTFIEIFSLSVSFMFVILIASLAIQEFTTDKFHENSNRLYLLANESFGFANKLGDKIKERYPEIEDVCHMVESDSFGKISVKISDNEYNVNILFTDPAFFSMFSFNLQQGEYSTIFDAKNNAVVTESFARKAFPNTEPLGKTILINESLSVVVSGIMNDIHNSVIPNSDIIVRLDNIGYVCPPIANDDFSFSGIVPIFFLAKEGVDIYSKEGELLEYLKEILWTYQKGIDSTVSFIPIRDAYFSKINGADLIQQGDKQFVLILLSAGILILIFAIINYVNLAVAQAGFRAKEMATRKLLGASRTELFMQLMIESFLLCAMSFFISIFLAYLALSYTNNLLQTYINLRDIFTLLVLFASLTILLLTSSLSGFIPAILISKVNPVEVVKGAFRRQNKMMLSKFFITFQYIVTIAMIAASITMSFQTNYLIKAPLGYNTNNIINIEVSTLENKQQMHTLANELNHLPVVKRTAFSMGTPFITGNNITMEYDDRNIELRELVCDSSFFKILGFTILYENNVSGDDASYLTVQAAKILGISNDALSFPYKDTRRSLSGIIKDFQLQNIAYENIPAIVTVDKFENFYPWNMIVEVQDNPYIAMSEVEKVYEKMLPFEFEGKFLDQEIEESFVQQIMTAKVIVLFSIVTILLSVLGLTAMASYFIQQRSREIAIRKVFGSNNTKILQRLVTMYLKYVVIAFIIVTPIIWHLMNVWLQDFAYHIELDSWIFIVSGLLCLLISFFTVFWQIYCAACKNPVLMIKKE
jgi:putative ABC transport system permease protein